LFDGTITLDGFVSSAIHVQEHELQPFLQQLQHALVNIM
jgi:hypothetical protein